MIKLYNSLSRKKEKLPASRKKPLRLFVCGPTVYDYAHLGHGRTFVIFDTFVRFLRSRGIEVTYLQNITDVDDKIIKKAKEEKKTPKEIAERYEKTYTEDMISLNVTSVDVYAKASNFISQIVAQVETLLEKGYAYEIPGDGYYFEVSKFKEYGKLSHRTALGAEDSVSRIDESVKKRNKADFALWKYSKPGEPVWKTSLGPGRPGWHIEDTAITETFFGPQYEIHGGALDLKFPHHEAEIAQQESASGKKPFVKIWMHAGFLLTNGSKMSKSLKNFVTIRDFVGSYASEKYASDILRMFVLGTHYRSPIDFTEKLRENAENAYGRLSEFLVRSSFVSHGAQKAGSVGSLKKELKTHTEKFFGALEDDFNTPQALAALFGILAAYESKLWNLGRKEGSVVFSTLSELMEVLGFQPEGYVAPPKKIQNILEKRELYRGNKQFTQADALREKIHGLGYELEDTPLGPLVYTKRN